jgi:hypothetical protein
VGSHGALGLPSAPPCMRLFQSSQRDLLILLLFIAFITIPAQLEKAASCPPAKRNKTTLPDRSSMPHARKGTGHIAGYSLRLILSKDRLADSLVDGLCHKVRYRCMRTLRRSLAWHDMSKSHNTYHCIVGIAARAEMSSECQCYVV